MGRRRLRPAVLHLYLDAADDPDFGDDAELRRFAYEVLTPMVERAVGLARTRAEVGTAGRGDRRRSGRHPVFAGVPRPFGVAGGGRRGLRRAFLLLTLVIRASIPVGVAYGIWVRRAPRAPRCCAAMFGDPFTWPIVVGIGLIMAGVLLVELGSRPAARKTRAVMWPALAGR